MTIRQIVVYNINMEMKYESCPTDINNFVIKDTQDINAKNVMVMLMYFSTAFEDIIEDNPLIEEFLNFTNEIYGHERYKKMKFIIDGLPWTIADAFLEFLRNSPRIHVTID